MKEKKENIRKVPSKTFLNMLFPRETDKDAFFLFLFLLVYIAAALIGISHHEMWRDELEPWVVASMRSSLSDFFNTMKIAGNPYLWYLILYLLSKISLNPVIVQIAHITIATAAVYLFLRFAPFAKIQKLLFCMGYYILFEYGIISRGYSLTIFFLFLFCSLYPKFRHRNLVLPVVVFLLANAAGGFGAILSISLLFFLGSTFVFDEMSDPDKKQKIKHLGWATLIILCGIYVAIKSMAPPADSIASKWYVGVDFNRLLNVLWRVWEGFVPIPVFTRQFWNTNILVADQTSSALSGVLTYLSLLLLIYSILLFSKKISVLVFYLSGTTGILLFSYMNPAIFIINGSRYRGFFFITFMISLWLLNCFPGKQKRAIPFLTSLSEKVNVHRYKNVFVMLLLIANVIAGATAYIEDFLYTFSSVEATGKYITKNNLQRYPMAGFVDYAVLPITAFTRVPMFFPETNTSSFPRPLGTKYATNGNQIIGRLIDYVSKKKDSVLVVANCDLNTALIGNVHFSHLATFKGSIVPDENYHIYMAHSVDTSRNMIGNLKSLFYSDIAANRQVDQAYFQLGMLYYREQQGDSALLCWEKTVSLNPNCINAYNNLGVAYLNFKHDFNNAEKCWIKTVQINPDYIQGYFNLMLLCRYKNDERSLLKYIHILLRKGISINDIKGCLTSAENEKFSRVK